MQNEVEENDAERTKTRVGDVSNGGTVLSLSFACF